MGSKSVSKRNAKFFCENCGEEVPQNARVCTKCGKFFTFVRCPNCSFTGESKIFTNGCPECGYAVNPYGGLLNPKAESNAEPKTKGKKRSFFNGFEKSRANNSEKNYDSSLPIWVYIVTLIVLIAVIFGLYSCL